MAYIYSGVTSVCGYQYCHAPLVQSDKAGRVKRYCGATCRKAAHRQEIARIEHERLLAEKKAEFMGRVEGTPEAIWPMLAMMEAQHGTAVMEQTITITKAAIAATRCKNEHR